MSTELLAPIVAVVLVFGGAIAAALVPALAPVFVVALTAVSCTWAVSVVNQSAH